ncbi:unnamed protein product [Pedinophyceae sp. YPF-701]|nr:unnamed protein product [Pedinophyceae sp. YPF-701]
MAGGSEAETDNARLDDDVEAYGCFVRGEWDAACLLLQRTLASRPGDLRAHHNLAIASFMRDGDARALVEQLARLLRCTSVLARRSAAARAADAGLQNDDLAPSDDAVAQQLAVVDEDARDRPAAQGFVQVAASAAALASSAPCGPCHMAGLDHRTLAVNTAVALAAGGRLATSYHILTSLLPESDLAEPEAALQACALAAAIAIHARDAAGAETALSHLERALARAAGAGRGERGPRPARGADEWRAVDALLRARLSVVLGDPAGAREYVARAEMFDGGGDEPSLMHGGLLVAAGQPRMALRVLEDVAGPGTAPPGARAAARLLAGRAWGAAGARAAQQASLVGAVSGACKVVGGHLLAGAGAAWVAADAAYALGGGFLRDGHVVDAARCFVRAAPERVGSPELWVRLAECCAHAGRRDAAPDWSRRCGWRAVCAAAGGGFPDAAEALADAECAAVLAAIEGAAPLAPDVLAGPDACSAEVRCREAARRCARVALLLARDEAAELGRAAAAAEGRGTGESAVRAAWLAAEAEAALGVARHAALLHAMCSLEVGCPSEALTSAREALQGVDAGGDQERLAPLAHLYAAEACMARNDADAAIAHLSMALSVVGGSSPAGDGAPRERAGGEGAVEAAANVGLAAAYLAQDLPAQARACLARGEDGVTQGGNADVRDARAWQAAVAGAEVCLEVHEGRMGEAQEAAERLAAELRRRAAQQTGSGTWMDAAPPAGRGGPGPAS